MITLLNLGQSERNQMHDLIAMDLKVFDDKSAFKVIDNDVAMLEQTIDNLKTSQYSASLMNFCKFSIAVNRNSSCS
jgi:pyruvate-formate lyase-activating enzyme